MVYSQAVIPGLLVVLFAGNASGLAFRAIQNDGFQRRVLLIYDCGNLSEDSRCLPHETKFTKQHDNRHALAVTYKDDESLRDLKQRLSGLGLRYDVNQNSRRVLYVYQGDEAELRRYLGSQNYEEVWLLSGGGDVEAGLGIGGTLRDFRMAVRVPSSARLREAGIRLAADQGAECVSSCTIAFMGGLFRLIDENATYQIHAASSVLAMDAEYATEVRERFYVPGGLRAVADHFAEDARLLVRDALVHFHNTLLLTIPDAETRTERSYRDRELRDWVLQAPGRYPYPPEELGRDTRIYKLEGDAALQDIVMRVERRAIDVAIADLRLRLPKLGRRAGAALAMVEAMYDTSSIKESNVMARETLLKMGYITEDVK